MFDSTNYPYDVQYTVKQDSKPVETISYPSLAELQAINLELAEKDYQHNVYMLKQTEYDSLDDLWSQYLAV